MEVRRSLAADAESLVTRAGSRILTTPSGDSDCTYVVLSLTRQHLKPRDAHTVCNWWASFRTRLACYRGRDITVDTRAGDLE